MSALEPAENGFLRPRSFERRSYKEIAASLQPEGGEAIYHTSSKSGGAKQSRPLRDDESVDLKPGDTLSLGPAIVKAASLFVTR
ncbi:hypothetical protein BJL95_20115 [Methylomonas sp. LWB]|nr:hypothetical protein BJL95_20115 [Methylomonas sp. LWB]